jgi:hypothetical protein
MALRAPLEVSIFTCVLGTSQLMRRLLLVLEDSDIVQFRHVERGWVDAEEVNVMFTCEALTVVRRLAW